MTSKASQVVLLLGAAAPLTVSHKGTSGGAVKGMRYKNEGHKFDSRWCHRNFFIGIILPAALRPWGRLSLEQK